MKSTPIDTNDEIIRNKQVSLLDLLDKLLDKGVVIKGEILLSVADIDLVYLNVGLLLSSVKTVVKTVEDMVMGDDDKNSPSTMWQKKPVKYFLGTSQLLVDEEEFSVIKGFVDDEESSLQKNDLLPMETDLEPTQLINVKSEFTLIEDVSKTPLLSTSENEVVFAEEVTQMLQFASKDSKNGNDTEKTSYTTIGSKTHFNPENVEKGLTKLVLTVIDLLRNLMEKQAIRRIEAGQVNESEIERVADTFFLLDQKMEQLKEVFDLQNEELNLDLGPLGKLI